MSLKSSKEVLQNTFRNISRNHTSAFAAGLAYYFVLSLFPGLILLAAALAVLPIPGLFPANPRHDCKSGSRRKHGAGAGLFVSDCGDATKPKSHSVGFVSYLVRHRRLRPAIDETLGCPIHRASFARWVGCHEAQVASSRFCFLSGHEFTRADKARKMSAGFTGCGKTRLMGTKCQGATIGQGS